MKKFLIKLSYTVLPVFLILFGLEAYVSLHVVPRATGDLGNLALIEFEEEYEERIFSRGMKEKTYFDVNATEDLKDIHVNVLTVGDSFSQLGEFGYQNYMSAEGLTVANTKRNLYDSPIQYAYNLLDWGVVDSTNIDVMVVEVGERDFPIRINNFSVDKIEKPDVEISTDDVDEETNTNKWSLLRTRDYVMYRLGVRCPVYSATLSRDFFECDKPRTLYFYYADILNGIYIDDAVKHKIKEVFDMLTQMAHERGFVLMFMLPVDKYDLYQDFIVDNPYPHPKQINEDVMDVLGDIPEVMLSKYYLQPLLEKGEKDVFLFNNSHWSYKAAEVVGKELSRRIISIRNDDK